MSDHVEPEEDREEGELEGTEVSAEPAHESAIQIDAYGVKARIAPAATGDPRPRTWAEVGRAVNLKLMAIAIDLVGLPADLLEGSRKLVRGLSKVSRKPARRIERGHAKADRLEGIAQEKAETIPSHPMAPDAADRIETLILRKQAEGFSARILDLGAGRQAIVFVKPEQLPTVDQVIKKALPSPTSSRSNRPQGSGAPWPIEIGPPDTWHSLAPAQLDAAARAWKSLSVDARRAIENRRDMCDYEELGRRLGCGATVAASRYRRAVARFTLRYSQYLEGLDADRPEG